MIWASPHQHRRHPGISLHLQEHHHQHQRHQGQVCLQLLQGSALLQPQDWVHAMARWTGAATAVVRSTRGMGCQAVIGCILAMAACQLTGQANSRGPPRLVLEKPMMLVVLSSCKALSHTRPIWITSTLSKTPHSSQLLAGMVPDRQSLQM